jgi:hypothetical protein
MDEIIETHDAERALEFLATLGGVCVKLTVDDGWKMTADVKWVSPDWDWFGSPDAGIFAAIDGYRLSGKDNIGLRHARFSSSEDDYFTGVLELIIQVFQWRGHCIRECDAWLAEHLGEIEEFATNAFARDEITLEALTALHEWIYTLAVE